MTHDLAGRVILVTGATDGIGKAAATAFARRGATLTILGRSREKTERVLAELKAASENEAMLNETQRVARVGHYVLDVASGRWSSSPGRGRHRGAAELSRGAAPRPRDPRPHDAAHGREEVFRELRARDPGLRVMLSSGYGETEVAGRGLAGFAQKPYPLGALQAALRRALA